MKNEIDLNRPAHHIANDVMRQLEQILADSGVNVAFGVRGHNVIARLVQQYQDKLSQPTIVEQRSRQEADEDAAELRLRTQLAAARFPAIEDVYVATAHCCYVTFATLLTMSQTAFAESALQLNIERTYPLRNRYRITFMPTDKDEE